MEILRRCFEVTLTSDDLADQGVLVKVWLVFVLSEPSFQVFIIGQKRGIVPPAPDLSRKFI